MSDPHPTRTTLLIAAAGATLLLGACSGSDSDDSAASDTEGTTTGAAGTTAPAEATPPETAAPETAAAPTTTEAPVVDLAFSVDSVVDGAAFPTDLVCDQGNLPPVVRVESVPDGTAELAMIVDDPDAPTPEPFSHWIVYGIPGESTEFTDAAAELTYGINDAGVDAWVGPCPPPGDGPHTYVFQLFALPEPLGLAPGLDALAARDAIEPIAIATAEITATHER